MGQQRKLSAHARPPAQPPIDVSGNFPAPMSAEQKNGEKNKQKTNKKQTKNKQKTNKTTKNKNKNKYRATLVLKSFIEEDSLNKFFRMSFDEEVLLKKFH